MKRQVKWMVYGIMLLLSVGCREDVDALYGVKSRPGIPVCFTTAWPQDVAGLKRGIADKKDFKEADVIHVSAEFTLDPLTTRIPDEREGDQIHDTDAGKRSVGQYQNGGAV